ncbi:ATP-binding cassette domain-containing protein [Aurantiacibacter aquimixticola]|uniref:ATP-binding cassette domain-containing protein n=1 Tax=Aurantiacibacter aquimixticola TaxID=1958945 RepID=A0A419RTT4_9SPHN|nr:ATP-binding cassette domain-containing protein [Aurantiacibacter aquimixticola]RJY09203.1 ATP-binding cassette domain-containing protein [Aurantiacibacter aquimixticola]
MSFEIDVTLRPGEHPMRCVISSTASVAVLIGPSGVGKTSALNAIAGLLRPEQGRIAVSGETLFNSATDLHVAPERRGVGYVFQDARLFPHRRVAGNLAFAERLAEKGASVISRSDIIEILEIGDLLNRWPATLSGGETKRVAIARALLSGPKYLLLDEPLASLDADRANALYHLIERIRDEIGLPILLVSHSASDITRLAGDVFAMK